MKTELKSLFASLISVVLAAFCLVASVFAWFASNTTSNVDNFNVNVEVHGLDASYTIYKYEGVDIIESEDLTLPEYDSIITTRNDHTPLVLALTLSGASIEYNTPLYLDIFCTDTETNTMSLSNVLYFKGGFMTINSENIADIYNQTLANLNNSNEYKFLDTTKVQRLTITLNNYQSYKINNNTVKYYIKIDYSPTLVSNLVELDFSSVGDTNIISFNPDITRIEIYEEGD